MPLDFPTSPTNGQVYSSGDRRWVWNSANNTWDASSVTSVASDPTPTVFLLMGA